MVDVAGQSFVVVGAGQSGQAAAQLLSSRGAKVALNDMKARDDFGGTLDSLEDSGVRLVLGGHPEPLFANADHIVLSPGVPPLAAVAHAEAKGTKVHSEVELASWFLRGDIVAITGTNGKSTVTTMIAQILEKDGRAVFAGGNLGTPLVDAVDSEAGREGGVVVAELSSFQLERVSSFRADVGVLLNVSADHLDRYDDFSHYARTKARIFVNQGSGDFAVLGREDQECFSLSDALAARTVSFGFQPEATVRVTAESIEGPSGFTMPLNSLSVVGSHNHLNAAAAVSACLCLGATPAAIVEGLQAFRGLPHRVQYVGEFNGVTYIDDSKATNVGAAVAAVRGVSSDFSAVWLIAGGRDKGGGYAELVAALSACGAGVLAIGEAASLIEGAFAGANTPVHRCSSMGQAVSLASTLAASGTAVLLAPACSSYDMYRSYMERGRDFQQHVVALQESANG